ncbi:MAG: sigma-70 family RNA polymerase sigma factor [Acidobacteriota bacterium]|jgi:RNA polymerase sigma-70 factor, ECF subfamily
MDWTAAFPLDLNTQGGLLDRSEGELCPDTEDVLRFQAGQEEAFECLVRRHEAEVYRTAFRFLQDEEDALEASQEAFLRAYRGLGAFRGDSNFKTWLTAIALNVCRNKVASAGEKLRRRSFSIQASRDEDGREMDYPVSDTQPTPDVILMRGELQKLIQTAISKLSHQHAEILILREMQGLDYKEVAEILCCPVGTVKSRLRRARQALREAVEGMWP